MKKVIFVLIDSLMPHVLESQKERLKGLRFLMDHGTYHSNMVTVFPTMTASVDSSLMTGVYPDTHKVPGLIWWNPHTGRIVNYVNGGLSVWKSGLRDSFRNVFFNMNEVHLSRNVTTIFEELEARGKTSASINFILHRGKKRHPVQIPWYLRWMMGISKNDTVPGPDWLTLGRMVRPHFLRSPKASGPLQGFGINDDFAADAVKQMVHEGMQPDLTMVYLPDNDHHVHKTNPDHGGDPLLQADQKICSMLDAFPSWEEAIEKNIWVIGSDHGQTAIPKDPEYNIDLDDLLQSFCILPVGKTAKGHHEVAIANNERMTYIYPLKPGVKRALLPRLVERNGIDFVAWKEGPSVHVESNDRKGRLSFTKDGPYTDEYGRSWSVEGNLEILDLSSGDDQRILARDYPDALSRLYGALFSQEIDSIVITAEPRYEFSSKYYPTHLGGGSHGSLHRYDSTIPLIVAGTNRPIPQPPRLVDLKDYFIRLLTEEESLLAAHQDVPVLQR
jgi:hypothetical protein